MTDCSPLIHRVAGTPGIGDGYEGLHADNQEVWARRRPIRVMQLG